MRCDAACACARAHCTKLDRRLAASRAACTAGKSSPTKIPMIAITTNNSTNVNPDDLVKIFGRRSDRKFDLLIVKTSGSKCF